MSDDSRDSGQHPELSKYRESLRGRGSDLLTTSADAEEVDAYLIETSYQLRTPLSVIVGYTEFLLEEADDPDEVRYLATQIQDATASLMEVIEQLEEQVARERARRRISELLRSLSTMMAASLDFDEVIETIHECLEEVFDFDRSTVMVQRSNGRYQTVAIREEGSSIRSGEYIESADDARLRQIERSMRPLVIADTAEDPRCDEDEAQTYRSWLGTPLTWSDELIGVLTLETREPRRYDSFDVQLIGSLGTQAGLAIVNAQQYGEAKTRAEIDGLTGAVTRRKFLELAGTAVDEAREASDPLSILMIDLDHFKEVNDTYGHAAGDFVLNESVSRWMANLRPDDVIGRYGGEEFIAMLPGLPVEEAAKVAERLRKSVEAEPFNVSNHVIEATASVGVAQMRPEGGSLMRLVEEADIALYRAKRRGRNRVEQRT